MEEEDLRLATFITWPHSAPVSAVALARAGFFYKGPKDRVECFACRGQIKEWEYGDTAMGEHKKYFPKCPFVRDINYKNVPIGALSPQLGTATEQRAQEKAAVPFKASPSETRKNQSGKKATEKPAKADGFDEFKKTQLGKPVRQPTIDSAEHETKLAFRSEYKRLLSFQNWPSDYPMDPRDLAKAGFYSLEKEDVVQCFACFGKINRWEPGDVALTEHEKHFPSCPFVLGLDVKNEPISVLQMIRATSMNYREPSEFEPALQFPLYTGENKRLSTFDGDWPGVRGIGPDKFARDGFFYTATAMSSCVTTRVLEMGYDRHLVKKVVKHRLQTHGVEFETTNDLLEAVWQADESGTLSSSDEEELQQIGGTGTVEKFTLEMSEKKWKSSHKEDNLGQLSKQLMGEIQIWAATCSQLEEEIERLRDEKSCKVCMDQDANTVLMPCTHLVVCRSCSKSLNNCPICRTPIREVVIVHKS